MNMFIILNTDVVILGCHGEKSARGYIFKPRVSKLCYWEIMEDTASVLKVNLLN